MMNESFNAARGFVGGATFFPHGVLPRRDVFQCRTRLCGWCNSYGSIPIRVTHDSFNAARGFVGGAARHLSGKRSPSNGFNAARSMICGATSRSSSMRAQRCGFNAARSIVCGATKFVNLCQHPINVFQCRTQHDMWCNNGFLSNDGNLPAFQCRTQHDMWCNASRVLLYPRISAVSMPHAA